VSDFAEFFGARRDIAFRAVLVAVGDRAIAEDAVAEAFARAYQRWSSVREHPNPTAWVIRTAMNVSHSWWRRRRREILTPEGAEPRSYVAPASDLIDETLTAAIQALPRRQREVVAMRILADLSAEETGQMLGIGAATVHVHLHRGLDALRRELAQSSPAGTQPLPSLLNSDNGIGK
jgi:RNA polymerase sigma factor (sigma-70 family)